MVFSSNLRTNGFPQQWRIFTSSLLVWLVLSCGAGNSPSIQSVPSLPPAGSNAPVPIYYGLNETNSTCWAQRAASGILGIVYRKLAQDAAGNTIKSLVYKTISSAGMEAEEVVATGDGAEMSVLLYDSNSNPHVFMARSGNTDQTITHFSKNSGSAWSQEIVMQSSNEGGRFIYELTTCRGPNDVLHLLVLKIRSNPDSYDYFHACEGSNLYYISNKDGNWTKELLQQFDSLYTLDEYVKVMRRQAMTIDKNGFPHIAFGVEVDSWTSTDHSILKYATNRSGKWIVETALTPKVLQDDAGWNPSIAMDAEDRPVVASTYIARVPSRSATSAQLQYSVREKMGVWNTTVVTSQDDGYFGGDGRGFTGAMPHLVFDQNFTPHIIFSDIASSHAGRNYLNIGQIRYAILEAGAWNLKTIYHQPNPTNYFNAEEMGGHCLLVSRDGANIDVVGQAVISSSERNYKYELIHHKIK